MLDDAFRDGTSNILMSFDKYITMRASISK